jgi:FkbM family methyltransferase
MKRVLRLIRSLALLANPKSWGPFVQVAEATKFDHAFSVSWSQGGEDLALLSIFGQSKKGTYLDVGAHHPSRFSVTRHLYKNGWHGVNVDASKALVKEFEKTRIRDINLCFAVGEQEEYEFTIFQEPAISTINAEWKDKFLSESNLVDRVEIVKGRRLREIYDDFFPDSAVDILAIDAEGADFEILKSLNLDSLSPARYPKYLMLETPPLVSSALTTPAVEYAMGLGYAPLWFCPCRRY